MSAFGWSRLVLTIGKLGRSRGRLEYYDAQVAAGAEDYYAGRGESPGRWGGAGATTLALSTRLPVKRHEFMALMQGRHPISGEVLRRVGARSTVAGFDLTFSAPKSVSVLFAIADDAVAGQFLAAHEQAVEATLAYLERESCFTRRGHEGAERLRGEGFVAASYRHRMSRAGDPQLHTHVIVANLTRADGRFTALDARALYEHKSAGGAIYRAVLRAEVRARLPWASWHGAGRGLFELDGVPDVVLRHFSQRRAEIEARALELARPGAGGELSRERMQGIALATRRAKTYGSDGGTWREEARARAAEHGLGETELARLEQRRPGRPPALDLRREKVRLSRPDGLTKRHNTFARHHVLAELAGAFAQGTSVEELEQATSGYLTDPSVVELAAEAGDGARYTTAALLALERDIIEGAARRASETAGAVPRVAVERGLARERLTLNGDQAAAVRGLAASGRGVDLVTALAGTGKTTMVRALAKVYEEDGRRVIGAAPTARAARQLREIAGIEADTMHALAGRLQQVSALDARTVLVLDEAGMAPTRLTAALLSQAELAGAKVIVIGDPGQLTSVEAGGWLGALAARQPGPELRQVMRQRDPVEQLALEALHDGDPEPYLTLRHDVISVHECETSAQLAVRDAWQTAQHRHGRHRAVMIARDNYTRERLNRVARAALQRDGLLDPDRVRIGGRAYAIGDRVVARCNDRSTDLDNGTLATVIAVVPSRLTLSVLTDGGQQIELAHDYVAAHLEHAYALTGHAAQGGTVAWAAVVGRPGEFTREWAYTVLSRAQNETEIHLIAGPGRHIRDREEYAPAEPACDTGETLQALRRALRRSEAEPLALERFSGNAVPPEPTTPVSAPPAGPELRGLQTLRSRGVGRSLRL